MHDALDGAIATAVNGALTDKALAENVTKAVLRAIEGYEDERFLTILQESEETGRVDMEKVRDALKS